MYLVKSCYEKDHILHRRTIKLGTLYEYREIEAAQIVDPEEGVFRFKLSLDEKVEVSKAWANAMFAGGIGFGGEAAPMLGPVTVQFDRMSADPTGEHTVVFEACNALIERHAPNSFIYCMSAVRRVSNAHGIFPDYDASWAITRSRTDAFSKRLGMALIRTLESLEREGTSALPKGVEVRDLQILIRHELVKYVPREQHIRINGTVSVDDFMQSIYDMSFVKPPSYRHELEYRFSYTLVRDGLVIQPIVKNIILPAEDMIDLLV